MWYIPLCSVLVSAPKENAPPGKVIKTKSPPRIRNQTNSNSETPLSPTMLMSGGRDWDGGGLGWLMILALADNFSWLKLPAASKYIN